MALRLLIADDKKEVRDLLRQELERLGYKDVVDVATPTEALEAAAKSSFDVAVVDLNFSSTGGEGIELTRELKRRTPSTRVVVLTVTDRGPMMIAAIRAGADDYVWKGSYTDIQTQLPVTVRRMLAALEAELQTTIRRTLPSDTDEMVGVSPAMVSLRSQVERAHTVNAAHFTITGETGAGKGALAHYVWQTDPVLLAGSSLPFLTFNCGDTTAELARSELFGIAADSGLPNTGREGRPGLFALARGGYVLLDDFQELPSEIFGALLHVLENRQVKRVGGSSYEPVRFKLIVTSQKTLDALPRQLAERLRQEGVSLRIPALRERRVDTPLLVERFFRQFRARTGLDSIAPEVVSRLQAMDFPGNVRELKNAVWQLCLNAESKTVTLNSFFAVFGLTEEIPTTSSLGTTLAETEKAEIVRALHECEGRVQDAAALLGLHPLALRRRAAKLAIPVGRDWSSNQKGEPS
jgi:DNA-binding NtrC family response regulator